MQKYKCPECKKMQDSAIQWQTRSTAYNYNLKTEEYEEIDNIIGETALTSGKPTQDTLLFPPS